jgi:hypothetical protein
VNQEIADDVRELWVVAPKGFRPSQWVEMLVDYDEAYEVDPYLVDRGYLDHHEILTISGEMFDPKAVQADMQQACLWEVLGKVSRLGLILNIHPHFSDAFPDSWAELQKFLADHPAKTETRAVGPTGESHRKVSPTPPPGYQKPAPDPLPGQESNAQGGKA